MKPGPPRTPTALALVRGNPGKRPKTNEPRPPSAEPDPPKGMHRLAVREWRRVVARLAEVGLMTDLDLAALAAYCDAFADWSMARKAFSRIQRDDKETGGFMFITTNGNFIQSPLVGTIRCARADMVRYAAEFGMTPSARAGMDINVGSKAPEGGAAPTPKAAGYYD